MLTKTINDKLNEGRQYRNIRLENIEVREADNNEKIVEGYATTFNTPYELFSYDNWEGYRVHVLEQIDSRAFDDCNMTDVIMQYDHEGRVFARMSNRTLEVNTDTHGLHIRAHLGGTELGRQLYEEIKGGYTDKMSFGFTVAEDARSEVTDRDNKVITITRTVTKISRLWDVSAVSLPANDATEISARKFSDGVIEELKQELLKRDRKKQKIRILSEVHENV